MYIVEDVYLGGGEVEGRRAFDDLSDKLKLSYRSLFVCSWFVCVSVF